MTTATKEQILEELHAGLRSLGEAQRSVFSALAKLSNLEVATKIETPATGQGGIAAFAAEHARKQTSSEAEQAKNTFLAANTPSDGFTADAANALAPQLSLDHLSPEALTRLGTPEVSEALRLAKTVLSDSLKKAGLPDHLLGLIDKVKPDDLYRVHAASKQPTQTGAPTELVEENPVLSAFIGPGSIFVERLSANAIFTGRGTLEPKVVVSFPDGKTGELKRHMEDVLRLEESVRREWPTGFYLNRDTKVLQFMVNTDLAAFIVDGLPSEVAPVLVSIYGSKGAPRPIQDYNASEQKLLYAKLEDALTALVKKNR
jgi:hypothetical protein